MGAVSIEGARVVLRDGVERVSVRFEAGTITALDGPRDGATVVDGTGLLLAPALVDVHGDAFERQVMPRPGVRMPLDAAFLDTDRQLAANGIATAYHGLTLSWEPGLRSVETGREIVRALDALSPRLAVDHRLQLRWETFCDEALPLLREVFDAPRRPSLAFNDHTSMAMLDPSVPVQERPFDFDDDFPTVDTESPDFRKAMAARAARSGMSEDAYLDLIRRTWSRRGEVPARVEEVAAMARAAGVPMLSHDDSQLRTRDHYRALGAGVSEFPMRVEVAEAARAAGDGLVFGAPNAARGGSHLGSPGAADMIRAGCCDALASDYHYPSMLLAMARLAADRVAPLHALWRLVSAGPAALSGLDDRGEITPGLRADLVLVDWPDGGVPVARATWSGGREAYRAMPAAG